MNQPNRYKKLRIALFTALYTPFLSGISVAVHQRVRWLLEQGHEVFLIYPQSENCSVAKAENHQMPGIEVLESFPGFRAYAYPTKPLIFYKSLPEPLSYKHWSDTSLLEDFQPNIIIVEEAPHMRGFYSLFSGGYGRPIGVEYAVKKQIPNIVLFHTDILAYSEYYFGSMFLRLFSPLISALVKQFSQAYDKIYFPSLQQLTKYQKMKVQKGEYLPYQGVDCDKFKPQNSCYDPLPGDRRQTLLFVGRLASEKNIKDLIAIIPLITDKIPDIHIVIVGTGPLEAEIRAQATQFKSNITVWGKSLGTELLGWFAKADLFVNPSLSENFCTTNMEALASGTPVVAFDAGGNSEQINSGVNGILVSPNNLGDFAQKIIELFKNPTLKQKMAQQARQTALDLDWSKCMTKLESELYQLV